MTGMVWLSIASVMIAKKYSGLRGESNMMSDLPQRILLRAKKKDEVLIVVYYAH